MTTTMNDELAEMGERTEFWPTIRGMINDGMEVEDAVNEVLDRPEFRQNIIKAVSTIVRGSVFRAPTRAAERRAVEHLGHREFRSAKSELLGYTFPTVDGRYVEWSKATPVDHRERALWFKNRSVVLDDAANLHSLAAQIIEDAGVNCLDEVDEIDNWPEVLAALKGQHKALGVADKIIETNV